MNIYQGEGKSQAREAFSHSKSGFYTCTSHTMKAGGGASLCSPGTAMCAPSQQTVSRRPPACAGRPTGRSSTSTRRSCREVGFPCSLTFRVIPLIMFTRNAVFCDSHLRSKEPRNTIFGRGVQRDVPIPRMFHTTLHTGAEGDRGGRGGQHSRGHGSEIFGKPWENRPKKCHKEGGSHIFLTKKKCEDDIHVAVVACNQHCLRSGTCMCCIIHALWNTLHANTVECGCRGDRCNALRMLRDRWPSSAVMKFSCMIVESVMSRFG